MGLEAHEETTQELLGYGLGLKPKGKTSSGKYKVDKDVLAEYSSHPVIKDLIEWKSLDKLKQFPDKWMEMSHNGRIYPSFNLTARTGRTTCSNPNLQQVPQSSSVRNLIGGKKGMKVIESDFSQAELRVASMFAGDENMQHAYNSGSDLHSKTTELLFGDTSQLGHDEQKRLRTYSKSMNFGFLYGMSAKTFVGYAKTYGLNLTQDESEKLREDFFNAYPRLPEWHDECKAFLHKHGYSYSPSGRKRFFPQVYSNNPRIVASAERGCVNAGVQGFASDLCVSALADVVFSEELDHSKFNVIGSVHDAILLEVQEDYAKELGEKVQKIMSHPSILDDLGIEMPVPLKADVSIGDAWGMEE